MHNNLEREIRSCLAEYVTGQATFEEFNDWFAPILWEVEDRGEPAATDLAYRIEGAVAEYSAGHLTEEDLRREMESIVLHNNTATSASAAWVDDRFPRVDTGSEMEFSSSSSC